VTPTNSFINAKNWLARFLVRAGWPAWHGPADNFATAGSTTADMLAPGGQVEALIAAHKVTPYERAFVCVGTNDTNGGASFNTVVSNLALIFDILSKAGIVPVYIGILPRGADGAITAAKRKNLAINSWAAEYAAKKWFVEYIDCGEYLADNSNSASNIIPALAYDVPGLHPSDLGAELMGEALLEYYGGAGVEDAAKTCRLIPQWRQISRRGDAYNAADNPFGVCFEGANPLMTGTAGSLLGGATGTAPDGMSVSAGAWSAGTQNLPNGQSIPSAVCVLSASATHFLYDDATASGAWASEGPIPGDVIVALAKVKLTNTTNITNLRLQLVEDNGSGSFSTECLNPGTPAKLADISGSKIFYLITPAITVRPYAGSGAAALYVRLYCTTLSGGGTMEVLSFEMRKRPAF
jgi:lysophospholipase L1-like esterase